MIIIFTYYFIILRWPSLPCGSIADSDGGYMFVTQKQKTASYLCAMDTLGQLSEQGTKLSLERFMDTLFFLPFKMSHELNSYSPDTSQRVLQQQTVKNTKTHLYLEFNAATTYVIRYPSM